MPEILFHLLSYGRMALIHTKMFCREDDLETAQFSSAEAQSEMAHMAEKMEAMHAEKEAAVEAARWDPNSSNQSQLFQPIQPIQPLTLPPGGPSRRSLAGS